MKFQQKICVFHAISSSFLLFWDEIVLFEIRLPFPNKPKRASGLCGTAGAA